MFGLSKNERLMRAVKKNDLQKVKVLLDAGADANAVYNRDYKSHITHFAAAKGYLEVLSLLLERGASIENADHFRRTALHFAAANGRLAVVEMLLSRGAYIEACDRDGETALHNAAANGSWPVCEHLLDKGAQVNVINEDGGTPLHFAANTKAENTEVIEGLLKRGADATLRTNKNRTALGLARSANAPLNVQALKAHLEKMARDEEMKNKKSASAEDMKLGSDFVYCLEEPIGAARKLVKIFNFRERVKTSSVEINGMAGAPAETHFDDMPNQVMRLRPIWEAYQAKGGTIGVDSIYPNGVQKIRLSEIGINKA